MKRTLKPAAKRALTWIAGGTAILWLAFVAYVDWAMHQTPEVFGRVMANMPMPAYFLFPFETMWMQARAGQVKPGDVAPDFTVKTLESRTSLQLASLWHDKPVVLVFGSYT
jgi:hypothetical protein